MKVIKRVLASILIFLVITQLASAFTLKGLWESIREFIDGLFRVEEPKVDTSATKGVENLFDDLLTESEETSPQSSTTQSQAPTTIEQVTTSTTPVQNPTTTSTLQAQTSTSAPTTQATTTTAPTTTLTPTTVPPITLTVASTLPTQTTYAPTTVSISTTYQDTTSQIGSSTTMNPSNPTTTILNELLKCKSNSDCGLSRNWTICYKEDIYMYWETPRCKYVNENESRCVYGSKREFFKDCATNWVCINASCIHL